MLVTEVQVTCTYHCVINYTCNRTCSLVEETHTTSLLKVSRPSLDGRLNGPRKTIKEIDENFALKAEIERLGKKLSQQRELIEQNVVIQTLEADKKRLLEEAEKEVRRNSEFLLSVSVVFELLVVSSLIVRYDTNPPCSYSKTALTLKRSSD